MTIAWQMAGAGRIKHAWNWLSHKIEEVAEVVVVVVEENKRNVVVVVEEAIEM